MAGGHMAEGTQQQLSTGWTGDQGAGVWPLTPHCRFPLHSGGEGGDEFKTTSSN